MKLALAILLTLATPALAWNEPDSISGVRWGATQGDLRVQLQRAGETVRCDSPELCVNLRASFGSVPVDIKYIFPKDGKLEMVILTFRPADYRKLRAVFVERYGEPMSAREEAYGSGCMKPTNEIVEWSGERVVMDLRRFASMSEGRATIMLKALRDRDRDTVGSGPEKEQKEQG
jgi:hypothetical protein